MPQLQAVTAFGSIDVELRPCDYERLDTIIILGLTLLISDAPGADDQIQRHLASGGYRNAVVYHNGRGRNGEPRRNLGGWPTVRVSGSYTMKDERMCRDADAGLSFWNGRSSGTQRNVRQLQDEGKPVREVTITNDVRGAVPRGAPPREPPVHN